MGESLKGLLAGSRRDIVIEMEPVLGQVLTNPSLLGLTGDVRRYANINVLFWKMSLDNFMHINVQQKNKGIKSLAFSKNGRGFLRFQ